MNVSFMAVGVNVLLNWVFTFHFGLGHRGLALSTGCVAVTNFAVLYWLMRRETRLLETKALIGLFLKLAIPCGLLLGTCLASRMFLLEHWDTMPFAPKTVYLLATIAIGGAVFFAAAAQFRIEEMEEAKGIFGRKLARLTKR